MEKEEHAHMARRATEMPHGNQRDVFKQRMDAQYLHVCRDVAKRATALARQEGLESIFLVGSMRLTEPIKAALQQKLRENVTLIAEDLARVSLRVLQEHVGFHMASCAEEYAGAPCGSVARRRRRYRRGLGRNVGATSKRAHQTVFVARGLEQEHEAMCEMRLC